MANAITITMTNHLDKAIKEKMMTQHAIDGYGKHNKSFLIRKLIHVGLDALEKEDTVDDFVFDEAAFLKGFNMPISPALRKKSDIVLNLEKEKKQAEKRWKQALLEMCRELREKEEELTSEANAVE